MKMMPQDDANADKENVEPEPQAKRSKLCSADVENVQHVHKLNASASESTGESPGEKVEQNSPGTAADQVPKSKSQSSMSRTSGKQPSMISVQAVQNIPEKVGNVPGVFFECKESTSVENSPTPLPKRSFRPQHDTTTRKSISIEKLNDLVEYMLSRNVDSSSNKSERSPSLFDPDVLDMVNNGSMANGKPLLSSVVSLQNEHSISVLMSLFEEFGACNLDLCRMDPVEGKNIFHYAIQNTSSDKFMCDFQTDRGIFSQIPSRSQAKSAFVAQKILKLVHEHDPEAFHHMLCQQSKQGHTPLVQAVICMNFEAARTILQMTVETSTRNRMVSIRDYRGRSSLHYAIESGAYELLDTLLASGADVDMKDAMGNSPLHVAAYKNCISSIKVLLGHKAKIDATNSLGRTPLFKAIESGANDAFELLAANNANVFHFDYNKTSALNLYMSKKHNLDAAFDQLDSGQFFSHHPFTSAPQQFTLENNNNANAAGQLSDPVSSGQTFPQESQLRQYQQQHPILPYNIPSAMPLPLSQVDPQNGAQFSTNTKIYDDLWKTQPLRASCALNRLPLQTAAEPQINSAQTTATKKLPPNIIYHHPSELIYPVYQVPPDYDQSSDFFFGSNIGKMATVKSFMGSAALSSSSSSAEEITPVGQHLKRCCSMHHVYHSKCHQQFSKNQKHDAPKMPGKRHMAAFEHDEMYDMAAQNRVKKKLPNFHKASAGLQIGEEKLEPVNVQ